MNYSLSLSLNFVNVFEQPLKKNASLKIIRLGHQMDCSKYSNFLLNLLLWATHPPVAQIKDAQSERKWCILSINLRCLLSTRYLHCPEGACHPIMCYSLSALSSMKATALWQSEWQRDKFLNTKSLFLFSVWFLLTFWFPCILISFFPKFVFEKIQTYRKVVTIV